MRSCQRSLAEAQDTVIVYLCVVQLLSNTLFSFLFFFIHRDCSRSGNNPNGVCQARNETHSATGALLNSRLLGVPVSEWEMWGHVGLEDFLIGTG